MCNVLPQSVMGALSEVITLMVMTRVEEVDNGFGSVAGPGLGENVQA